MAYSGRCFCGAVRYEVGDDVFHVTTCHCQSCRRVSGAPVLSWFTVRTADLRWLAGMPATFHSSAGVVRSFCAACGTTIGYQRDDTPGEQDLTLCSLDTPELLAPRDHTFTSERLPWVVIADGLPRYPSTRAQGPQAP